MTVANIRTASLLIASAAVAGLLQTSPAVAAAAVAAAEPGRQAAPAAQPAQPKSAQPPPAAPAGTPPAGAVPASVPAPPADYTIGPEDELTIIFWREKDLTGDVTVRPDGKISIALLNDVQAAGLTPDQLRKNLMEAAARYVTDPSVTIVVKTINSRKIYVTGQVNKPGTFPLTDSMTVLQMLALAGGLQEYADAANILVMRTEQGQTRSYKFNYKDVRKGKNLQQNILLKPGDTIVIP